MLRRLTVRWSVPTLLVGIAIGLGLSSWPWADPVHARPDDRRPIDAGAGDRVRSPLIEASRELARVAAEVTPSVVHIESKVQSLARPARGDRFGSDRHQPEGARLFRRHESPRRRRRRGSGTDFGPPERWPLLPSHQTVDRPRDRPGRLEHQCPKRQAALVGKQRSAGNRQHCAGDRKSLRPEPIGHNGHCQRGDAPCGWRRKTPSSTRTSFRPTRRSISATVAAR